MKKSVIYIGKPSNFIQATLQAWEKYSSRWECPHLDLMQNQIIQAGAFAEAVPGILADAVMPFLKADYRRKQQILETADGMARLRMAYALLQEGLIQV